MKSILIADDDIIQCTVLSKELRGADYNTEFVCNGKDAIEYLTAKPADLLLLDPDLPVKNGFLVLQELNEREINVKVIVLTADSDVKSAFDAARISAYEFFIKPYDFEVLLQTIEKALVKEEVVHNKLSENQNDNEE